MSFSVVDVTDWPLMAEEPVGADVKEWICPPRAAALADGREKWWLYKPAKSGIRKMRGGLELSFRRMDDVVERLVCELARLVGVPAADVELASRSGVEGMISRNVTPTGWEFQSADIVLAGFPGYESCAGDDRPRRRVGHNLDNIRELLRDAGGPPGNCGNWSAFDVFVGFLTLDAWVANTDRHAFNWAVLDRDGERRLAASFDHGSSLASGQPDGDLEGRDPLSFAHGGMVTRFEAPLRTTLVEYALLAQTMATAQGKEWKERVGGVKMDQVREILDSTPRLSVLRSNFLFEVLQENQRRLTI